MKSFFEWKLERFDEATDAPIGEPQEQPAFNLQATNALTKSKLPQGYEKRADKINDMKLNRIKIGKAILNLIVEQINQGNIKPEEVKKLLMTINSTFKQQYQQYQATMAQQQSTQQPNQQQQQNVQPQPQQRQPYGTNQQIPSNYWTQGQPQVQQ